MAYQDCPDFVPFSDYDWTFKRKGLLQWNPTAFCLIASFCAVAYWMCIELLVLVYVTFKRHTGLYFWSIIITTVGIILQTTGYILKEFAPACPAILTTIICKIGWVSNVTGFSVVLWSRLHLIVQDTRILKGVLAMIIVNGICLHTPVVVFEFGLISKHHDTYVLPMEIMERIQQTIFTVQETIISGMYIYFTSRFLNDGYASHTRNVIRLLVCVQALVIAFDAGLTTFDYMNMFTLKCTLHPFVYALKLKLEFIVLNQLLSIAKKGLTPGLMGLDNDSDANSAEEKSERTSSIAGSRQGATFITKPALVRNSTASSSGVDSTKPIIHSVMVSPAAAAAAVVAQEEEDLFDVIGRPDNEIFRTATAVSDVERQYLGRFVMGE